jgi:hypothetical protein
MESSREPVDTGFDAFTEISGLLKWCQGRVGPLTFTGIGISALLWLDFIKFYSLPVSFLSTSTLAALPALFAIVVFVMVTLTISAVMPAFVLWSPLSPDGPSLASLGHQRRGSPPQGSIIVRAKPSRSDFPAREALKVRGKLVDRWVILEVVIGIFWLLWVASTFVNVNVNLYVLIGLNFLLSLAFGFALFVPLVKQIDGKWPSLIFFLQLGGAIFAQSFVALSILFVFLKTTTDTAALTLASRASVYAIVLLGVSLVQLLAARHIALGPYPNMLKHATLIAIGIMIAAAMVPPVGASLVSYPLRTSAPDGGSCIVLTLLPVQTNASSTYATVQDLRNPGHSVPLAFVTHLEEKYYAKVDPLKGDVYPIPDASVGGIGSCPAKQSAEEETSPHSDQTEKTNGSKSKESSEA